MKVSKLSKAEMKKMSQISTQDIEDAKLAWKEDAPTRFRGLLDATKAKDTSKPGGI